MEMSQIPGGGDMIVSSTPSAANSPPVYNSTTVPLGESSNGHGRGNGASKSDEKYELNMFQNLPKRSPVDIQFKDISYCVNAGFRKGEQAEQ